MRQAAFEVDTGKSRAQEDLEVQKSSTRLVAENAIRPTVENEAASEVPTAKARTTAMPAPGIPVLSYVFGGVGLAGVAGYFVLNTWGRKDNDALGSCSAAGQLCQTSDIDHIRKLYLAANISGGIGLAALATSAWLYIRSSSSSEENPPARSAAPRSGREVALRMVGFNAGSSGALATVGGAF